MIDFIATFVVFALVMAGMSVGVVFMGRVIQGSCGGIGNHVGEEEGSGCDFCSNPEEEKKACQRRRQRAEKRALAEAERLG